MTPGGTSMGEGARRGTSRHVPVLLPEVLAALEPQHGETYIDGTFGAGGYAVAILTAAPGCRVLGIDRDRQAIVAGAALVHEHQGRLLLEEGCCGRLDRIAEKCGLTQVDGVVLDLGVSSMQIDDPARGFSWNERQARSNGRTRKSSRRRTSPSGLWTRSSWITR